MESLGEALLKMDHFIAGERQEKREYVGVGEDSKSHIDLRMPRKMIWALP